MLSQSTFANKMMDEGRLSAALDDRLDIKRSSGGGSGGGGGGGGGGNGGASVKCEDFSSLYSIHSSDAALSAATAVGGPAVNRSLTDHSGKFYEL